MTFARATWAQRVQMIRNQFAMPVTRVFQWITNRRLANRAVPKKSLATNVGLWVALILPCLPSSLEAQVPLKMRWQAAKWNLERTLRPTDPNEQGVTMTTVTGARKRSLREIMRTFPAPTRDEMHGRWRGLNKGVGPAMLGISQFAKEFVTLADCPYGDNITIRQCPPESWCSANAWQPLTKAGALDRHGNYVIKSPGGRGPFRHAVELNYGEARNPPGSPERFIVDKLVKLDEDHLLGYAMFQLGKVRFPGFYFVLERW